MSFGSEMLDDAVASDNTLSPTPKSFLGRLTVRKPSVLSISSAASSVALSSPIPLRRSISPIQDEEKRRILKMLISPSSERRPSKNINDFMMMADQTIKAAKSAENLSTNNQVLRQESSLSLQVPLPGMGQRKVTFSQVIFFTNYCFNFFS